MAIERIGIVGAGQMGSGIAQVVSQRGIVCVLVDIDRDIVDAGIRKVSEGLSRLVSKGKLTEQQKAETLARIVGSVRIEDLEKAEFVIEAVTESEEIKMNIFRKLDDICPADVILASNTSSISITKLASVTSRPDKVVGMHFMNPVPVMKLVEIVMGLCTSEQTYTKTVQLAERLDKTVITSKDSPGFIVNRVLMPMINEAIFALNEGVCSAKDIDTAMKLGTNHPMGPLELADLIGLDTVLSILEVLHSKLGEDKYRPCPLLRRYVDAGHLGRKTNRGFYQY